MMTRIRNCIRYSLTLIAIGLVPGAGAQSSLPGNVVRRIDSIFASFDSRTSPGCAVSVVRDGQLVFAKGYGMSDLQHEIPITPSSIFHVASISKQFAAMSIVLLSRDGKLSLDDDIRKHLPEVPDFGERITIRHLIHHTSGLRDQWQLLSLSGWRPDDPKSEADILWLVGRQRALNFKPGTEHLYSNTGYTLLGTIVQRVSGKPLRQFTTERIFTPLGMTSTHFHDDHTMIVPGRTSAYVPRQGGGGRAGRGGAAAASPGAGRTIDDFAISIPVFDNAGATSLFTTVEDMAKWERNFLQPKVGDQALLVQMYERGKLADGREIPYAFALTHGQLRGLNTIGHSGSDAGYRADFLRIPDQRHAFITLCNIGSANAGALNRSMAEAVLGDRMTAVQAGTAAGVPATSVRPAPIDPAVLRSFAGTYLDPKTDGTLEVVYRDSTKSLHPGNVNAPPLVHAGENIFVATGPGGQPQRFRFAAESLMDMQTSTVFGKVAPPILAPEKLAEVAGRYRSEELDVDWTIAVDAQGTVTLLRRRLPVQRLTPAYADAFTAPLGRFRFSRDSTGRVNGFLLTSGRIRHVRFDRVM